jgi:hypothetical protein
MSERSTYLQDQANRCRSLANAISDKQTQGELRKLPTNTSRNRLSYNGSALRGQGRFSWRPLSLGTVTSARCGKARLRVVKKELAPPDELDPRASPPQNYWPSTARLYAKTPA